MRKFMKVVKTSNGTEEIHYPEYYRFDKDEPVEVPVSIGMTLINRHDYSEVKSISELEESLEIRKPTKRRGK